MNDGNNARPVTLKEVAEAVGGKISGDESPIVSDVTHDSRQARERSLFVAIRGQLFDAHKFVPQVLEQGAVGIISELEPLAVWRSSTESRSGRGLAPAPSWIQVPDVRRAMAVAAAEVHRHPSRELQLVGITGTNGKTTTAYLIASIPEAAGEPVAMTGTVEYRLGPERKKAGRTTPEATDMQRLLRQAVEIGCRTAVMECSSQAMDFHRCDELEYAVAVFSNLTRDHLDYHKTMEEYFAAKRVLFEGCGTDAPRAAVTNADDEYSAKLAEFSRKRSSVVLKYGWARGDLHAEKVEITTRGTRFDLVMPGEKIAVFSALIGRVNVYNILAAAGAAYARGCAAEAIAEGIDKLACVPGRFERVDCGQPFTVVVDYAHTDDALRNLTALARELVSGVGSKGRVLTVFGCGGDRDRKKRPLMGEAAGRGSDFVVLTSDNPRSEDPLAIINDAVVGLQKTGVKYSVEADRRKAIALAIAEAGPGDIVLLAGKGHEKVQVTRAGSTPFDDLEVARAALRTAGFECEEPAGTGG